VIALIVGPDALSARTEAQRLAAEADPSGLNIVRMDGKTSDLGEVAAAVSTVSFFGGGRVVVVEDLMTRYSKTKDDDGASSAKSSGKDFSTLFESVPEGNSLILIDASLGTVPAAIKKAAPAHAILFGGEPPRGNDLIKWLQREAKAVGSSIDNEAARRLAELTFPQTWQAKPNNPAYDKPPDLDRLRNEILKLTLVAHPNPVSVAEVEQMVPGASEDRLFPFIEAAVSARLGEALSLLGGLQSNNEEPGRLVAQLYQQIELAAVVGGAGGSADPFDIGKEIGLSNPNRMIGVSRTARRGRVPTAEMLRRGLYAERLTKRGHLRTPDDVLYELMSLAAANAPDLNDKQGGR
jgi:DNA polymerase III delta subunit